MASAVDPRVQTATNLTETLRSGSSTKVVAELFVHAQTVRYRMPQLRELYGDTLSDPQTVLALTVALGVPSTAHDRSAAS